MFKDRKHFKCLLWKGLWGLGAVSFILAWVTTRNGEVFGFGAEHWFWDALVLAVLSIPIKLDCHDCSICVSVK